MAGRDILYLIVYGDTHRDERLRVAASGNKSVVIVLGPGLTGSKAVVDRLLDLLIDPLLQFCFSGIFDLRDLGIDILDVVLLMILPKQEYLTQSPTTGRSQAAAAKVGDIFSAVTVHKRNTAAIGPNRLERSRTLFLRRCSSPSARASWTTWSSSPGISIFSYPLLSITVLTPLYPTLDGSTLGAAWISLCRDWRR